MEKKIYANAIHCFRQDTIQNWEKANPVLEKGEIAIAKDGTNGEWLKIGDGETPWNELSWKKGPKGDDCILTESDKKDIANIVLNKVAQAENISYDKSKSGLESQNVQDAIDELAAKTENAVSIDSWQGVQRIVNLGLAQNAFKIGDMLKCNHSKYGELTWDVIDATPERLSLCAHNVIDDLQFDEREALYYAENGLSAGTYFFVLEDRPWYEYDAYCAFDFTLNSPVPAGAQLVLDTAHNGPLNNSHIMVYANAYSSEVLQTATVNKGGYNGTLLGYANGREKNLNHIARTTLGSNSYKESAIRQWLNSDGEAGNVWTPQTVFDRPPVWNSTHTGFLNGLDKEFLDVVSFAEYDTLRIKSYGSVEVEKLTDKFMLLSSSEIYAPNEVGVSEGEVFPYFSQFSNYDSPNKNEDSIRGKTHLKYDTLSPWWVRTPNSYSYYITHLITKYGVYTNGNDAKDSFGIVPACHIIKQQEVISDV